MDSHCLYCLSYLLFFIFFCLVILIYNIVLVLPYINMNLPWVYTCSPSWNPLPPPSPYPPSGSSQCTSTEHPVSWIEPGLAIHFTYDNLHVSMPFSHIILPSPSLTESKRLFYTSVSLLLSRIQGYHYHLSKFHIYALVYCIGWRRQWHPTPVLLPGKSHGWRSLKGCSPWGRWGSDTTEGLHFHFSLSCIGEGNGNPLSRQVFLPGESQVWGSPGGLLSMGSHRVGHDWSDLAA